MRFRRPSPPPSIWNGRDQRRAMSLLGLLVLVVIAVNLTANPANWQWLTGLEKEAAPPEAAREAPDRIAEVHEPEPDVLPPGGFRVPLPKKRPAESGSTEQAANQGETANDSPSAGEGQPIVSAPPDTPAKVAANREDQDVSLDPSLFDNIEEDSLNIRSGERNAYFEILGKARDLSSAILDRAALRNVTYTQVFSAPDKYRGKLITLEGDLRQLALLPAAENAAGIERVYEGWLFNRDSGNNPYMFRCTSIPNGIPQGQKLGERVRVTGYFFKLYQYPTARGLYSAPMFLAKTVRWTPAAAPVRTDPKSIPYILSALTVTGVVLGACAWWFAAGDGRRHRTQLKRAAGGGRDVPATLEGVAVVDLNEMFSEMSKVAQSESPVSSPKEDSGL